jgi:sortase A
MTRHWPWAAALAAAVFFASMAGAASAAWIPVKAWLAQSLLERAWAQALEGSAVPPWPWADTLPVAEIRVPRLGVRQIVLGGASGRNLAFGPVLLNPGIEGLPSDLIVGGHRDTHFAFLGALTEGDVIEVVTERSHRSFAVRTMEVADSRELEMVVEPDVERISLVTCYPLDSPAAGGPLRYVVTATPG